MSAYELAQLNTGFIRGPIDSPIMAEFVANLERINALADAAPGFVWRLKTEAGDATAIRPFEDPNQLLNMSVWRDADALRRFVYRSAHAEILARRREWFARVPEPIMVLWWVPRGHRPSIEEDVARLTLLRTQGPTAQAFTFRQTFPPPDAPATEQPRGFDDQCPAT
jgi:heme-degrading monooxygenase HmoA